MTIARVGVREFRAGLAHHIEGDDPVAVTRHGHTVGYFIPVRTDREADLAALRAAAAKLDGLLDLDDADVDLAVEDFRLLRNGVRARRR